MYYVNSVEMWQFDINLNYIPEIFMFIVMMGGGMLCKAIK